LVAGLAVAAVPLGSVAAPILSLDVNPGSVNVGDSVVVDVLISGVEDSSPLNAFSFVLEFDGSIIKATGVSIGPFLSGLPLGAFEVGLFITQSAVEYGAAAVVFAKAGSGVLAQVSFDAVASGTSPLTIAQVSLSGPFGDPIDGSNNASVEVKTDTPMPTPASSLLLALGLGSLMLARRRLGRTAVAAHRKAAAPTSD
jgi:hypothetical protein